MKTALQSFLDKIALKLSVEQVNEFLPEFEQAKEMEKQQIINTYEDGNYDNGMGRCEAEQYYKATFKSK
jgi:hypothetical protein